MNQKENRHLRMIDDLGRVVIPREVRQLVGIKEGDLLEVSSVDIENDQQFERYVLLKLIEDGSE